jgi:hypothetical protein
VKFWAVELCAEIARIDKAIGKAVQYQQFQISYSQKNNDRVSSRQMPRTHKQRRGDEFGSLKKTEGGLNGY